MKGDHNTGYYHDVANGRRRKCTIFNLEDGNRIVRQQTELGEHMEGYYNNLFGRENIADIHLHQGSGQEATTTWR
jgi:hypothetical protein